MSSSTHGNLGDRANTVPTLSLFTRVAETMQQPTSQPLSPKTTNPNPSLLTVPGSPASYNALTPILMIQHPIHQINTWYQQDPTTPILQHELLRSLYDKYAATGKTPRIVHEGEVPADDHLRKLSVGGASLDERVVLGERSNSLGGGGEEKKKDKAKKKRKPVMGRFLRGGNAKANEVVPNIYATHREWRRKYGLEEAAKLRRLADENMPHYEYLSKLKA